MRTLVLVRLGMTPNPAVTMALAPHFAGKKPVAFPIPGSIISVFQTESSIEEVSESIKETGALFFLMNLSQAQVNLPDEVMDIVNPFNDIPVQEPTAQQTFDEIMELVRLNGAESLTPEQKVILEQGLL